MSVSAGGTELEDHDRLSMPPSDPTHSSTSTSTSTANPSRRPPRLSLACNTCRKRKVRCDAQQPRCHNCSVRGDVCETSNLRKAGALATRKRSVRRPAPALNVAPAAPPDPTTSSTEVSNPADPTNSPDISVVQAAPSAEARGFQANVDAIITLDGDPSRVKFLGGSSIQALCRLVDVQLAKHRLPPVAPMFRHGMRHSEEMALPSLVPKLPPLPSGETIITLLDVYFDRIWPLYPILSSRADVETDIQYVQVHHQRSQPRNPIETLNPSDAPTFVVVYALVALAMDESDAKTSDTSTDYLTASYSLSVSLLARPYLRSAQALFLLALAMRAKLKHGQAWHISGQAVRLAQSIGLHRDMAGRSGDRPGHSRDPSDLSTAAPLHVRTWWCIVALERTMQLESGRPSSISNEVDVTTSTTEHSDCFAAWVLLASIMGRISEHVYNRRSQSVQTLLHETGTLHFALINWEQRMPEKMRVHNTLPATGTGDQTFSRATLNFLWIMYSHVHIVLLRVSLVLPPQIYSGIRTQSRTSPLNNGLLHGPDVCAYHARKIIMDTFQLADANSTTTLLGPMQPFLASAVLALIILRTPLSRLARSDLELIKSAMDYVLTIYQSWNVDPSFARIPPEFRERISKAFSLAEIEYTARRRGASGVPSESNESSRQSNANDGSMTQLHDPESLDINLSSPGHSSELQQAGVADEHILIHDINAGVFDETRFEDFWAMIEADASASFSWG